MVSTVAPLPAVELADRLDRSQQQPPWHVVLLDTKVMEIRAMKLVNVAIATVCAALLSLTICPAPAQVAGSQGCTNSRYGDARCARAPREAKGGSRFHADRCQWTDSHLVGL